MMEDPAFSGGRVEHGRTVSDLQLGDTFSSHAQTGIDGTWPWTLAATGITKLL